MAGRGRLNKRSLHGRSSAPPPPRPTAQDVGNSFVSSYYAALRNSPTQFPNFYQHNSIIGRPGADGVMRSGNKKQAIDQNMLLIGDGMPVEIKAVGAQYSVDSGLIIVARGYLIGVKGAKRSFTQTFFLDPKVLTAKMQRFYIHNDIFMYDAGEPNHLDQHGQGNVTTVTPPLEQDNDKEASENPGDLSIAREETSVIAVEKLIGADPTTPVAPVVVTLVVEESVTSAVSTDLTTYMTPVVEKSVTPVNGVDPTTCVAPVVKDLVADSSLSSAAQEDAPKKSFASIVKLLRENPAPFVVPPSAPAKPKPSKLSDRPRSQDSKSSTRASEQSFHQSAYCRSIYVGNLPLNVTVDQLKEEFTKFGPIKPSLVQVRRNEVKQFCFAFLEFENSSAAQKAIMASPMMIDGRSVFVEEKRRNGPRPLGSVSWMSSGMEDHNGGSSGREGSSGRRGDLRNSRNIAPNSISNGHSGNSRNIVPNSNFRNIAPNSSSNGYSGNSRNIVPNSSSNGHSGNSRNIVPNSNFRSMAPSNGNSKST